MEQFDINILKFQNKKLGERLEVKAKVESDLRQRIEQLEKKQTSAEAIVYVINRYWNQLNEDLRILLQRFDAETSDQQENDNENEATTSFISQLSTWDKDELEENLRQRVEVSKRAVSKVIATFDRIVQRNEKITFALKGTTLGDGRLISVEENLITIIYILFSCMLFFPIFMNSGDDDVACNHFCFSLYWSLFYLDS